MACKLTPPELEEMMRAAREDPAALPDMIRTKMNPTMSSKALELWKSGLLSSPSTHIVNFGSNALYQAMRTVERYISAGIQTGLSTLKPSIERDRTVGELSAGLAAGRAVVPDAFAELRQKIGAALTAKPEEIDTQDIQDHGIRDGAVGRIGDVEIAGRKIPVGRAIRAPLRLLDAADNFYKRLSGEQELYRQAYRHAMAERKSGPELGARIDEIAAMVKDDKNFSPIATAIRKEMSKVRLEETFQQKLHPVGEAARKLSASHPLLGVILPFVKTPWNVTKAALDRLPINPFDPKATYRAYKEYRTGKGPLGALTDDLAKRMLGMAIMGGVMSLTEGGDVSVTGGGPVDKDKQDNLKETGWQPYSIKIGDKYVSYRRASPLSQIIGIAADVREAKEGAEKGEMLGKLFDAIASNVTDQTFLSGLDGAARAIQDPRRYGSAWIKSLEGSVVPGAVRSLAYAMDPIERDAQAFETVNGIPEPIAARIPGLSQMLPAKRTATGEEKERQGGALGALTPFSVTTAEPGRELEKTFDEMGYVPSPPDKSVKVRKVPVRYTDDEYAQLRKADEKSAKELRSVVIGSGFKRLDPARQKAVIQSHYERNRGQAKNEIMKTHAFRVRAIEAARAR